MDEQERTEQQEAQRQIDMVACEAEAHEREELNRRAGEAETVRRDTAMSIDETAQSIRSNINELVAQRDDLLAVAKEIVGLKPQRGSFLDWVALLARCHAKARAAIARAEGSE